MSKEKNGFVGEYNYYVGVLTQDNELRFVDSVSYADKTATWSAGAKPMSMDKREAIQLQMGLMCNGSVALVIEAPDFLKLHNNESYERPQQVELSKVLEEIEGLYNYGGRSLDYNVAIDHVIERVKGLED